MNTLVCFVLIFHCILLGTNAGVHDLQTGKWSSQENDEFNVIFNDAVVKLKLNGVPFLRESMNVHPDNISALLTRYACKLENPGEISTVDDKLEIVMEYTCHEGHANGNCTRLAVILLILGVFICICLVALRAKVSSKVDGEVRWRMWRVPQFRFVSASRMKQDSQSDIVESTDTLYTDDSISTILSRTMTKSFTRGSKISC